MHTVERIRSAEGDLVAAARRGDERAFRRLVELHRSELHAHCYRMLGSVADAEDAVQDSLLRAWRGLPRHEGRSTFRTWLYRISTNVCLDSLARRSKRVLPIDLAERPDVAGRPAAEMSWIEPYPDRALGVENGYASTEARYERRETLELAFVAALQQLPPRQRAALVLRDVLGFTAAEAAEVLETTVASVNSGLQRARKAIEERLPDGSQQAMLRSLGDRRVRELVESLVDAFEAGDVDALVGLLAEDAAFEMPPYGETARGREAISRSWLVPEGPPGRLRCLATWANGQPAVAAYLLDPDSRRFVPIALDVVTLAGPRFARVTAFRTPAVFPLFGLPDELPAG